MWDYMVAIQQLPKMLQAEALDLLDELTREFNNTNYDQAAIDRLDFKLNQLLAEHDLI